MGDSQFAAYLRDPRERRFVRGKPEPGTLLAEYIRKSKEKTHLLKINVTEDGLETSSNLTMFGHHPDNIAHAIRNFVDFPGYGSDSKFEGENNSGYGVLTQSQRHGISEYTRLRAETVPNPEDVNVLEQYYDIFSEIFFFGALQNLCTIRLVLAFPGGGQLGECISHNTPGSEKIPKQSACLIELLNLRSGDPNLRIPRPRRLIEYLETLLHEMVHAFFAIYSCACNSCDIDQTRFIGVDGHQSSWQAVARAIEVGAGQMLKERLDLGRTESLAHDWYHHGEANPELLDYTDWNMTRREVRALLKGIDGDGGKTVRECVPGKYAEHEEGDEAGDFNHDVKDNDYEDDTDSEESEEDYDEMEKICTEYAYDEDIEEIEQMEKIKNQRKEDSLKE